MGDFLAGLIVTVLFVIGGLLLLWAILEMFDLAGYIFHPRKKKFFDDK